MQELTHEYIQQFIHHSPKLETGEWVNKTLIHACCELLLSNIKHGIIDTHNN